MILSAEQELRARALEMTLRLVGCDLDRALPLADRIVAYINGNPRAFHKDDYPLWQTESGVLTQFDQGWNAALERFEERLFRMVNLTNAQHSLVTVLIKGLKREGRP